MNTLNRVATGTLILLISANAFALRCGSQIISEGDSYYKIEKLCPITEENTVYNSTADIRKVYIEQEGKTHELIVIDGALKQINWGV